MEDALDNCVSCELWSAYRMKTKGMISKGLPVLKKDGEWVRNPKVRTDTWVENGEVVYGEMVPGEGLVADVADMTRRRDARRARTSD